MLLPRPAWTEKTWLKPLPESARWPIDLDALPPDWVHSAFATGSGSAIGSAAVAGSTLTSSSVARTATLWPSTGVVGVFFFSTLQPLAASAAARMTASFICFEYIIVPA